MFYTVKEVSKKLGLSLSMIYAIIARGDLACYKFGSAKRVRDCDLEEYLRLHREEVVAKPKSQRRHF